MKYISIVFVIFLASCGGSSDNPFAPLTNSDAPVTEQIPTQAPVTPPEPSSTTPTQTPVPVVDVVPEPQPEPEIIPEPMPAPVKVQRVMWCADNPAGMGVDWTHWDSSRQIIFYDDGTTADPDRLYSFWDTDGHHYINLYDSNWNAKGLSRVTDQHYQSQFLACADERPIQPEPATIEQSMNFEDYSNQTWECEQFGLQEGGNKSRVLFRDDGTGTLSFVSNITGNDVVSAFSWAYADGNPLKIEASFSNLFIDADNRLLTSGAPENALDHEYRCYFPEG